jgi:DUF4097 and DUF4098 domain-containing protein YvlB
MPTHRFETHRPVDLYVELGKGSLVVRATDTTETEVVVNGRDADHVEVEQDGDQISVIAPKQRAGVFGLDRERLDVTVTLPGGSNLAARTGSADVTVEGEIAAGRLKTGSGDLDVQLLTGPGEVTTGSGDVRVGEACAELRVKSGSGDLDIARAGAALSVSTGSGDVEIGAAGGPVVVKTGSGDLDVAEAHGDISFMTGSGDLHVRRTHRGRVTVKGASSDVLLGIPAGTPVWTDISTVSGEIRSRLAGAGQPEDGADHVEVRAKTVSGDIVLTEV